MDGGPTSPRRQPVVAQLRRLRPDEPGIWAALLHVGA